MTTRKLYGMMNYDNGLRIIMYKTGENTLLEIIGKELRNREQNNRFVFPYWKIKINCILKFRNTYVVNMYRVPAENGFLLTE